MTTLAEFETFVIEDVVKCDALINSTLSGVKFVGFDCEWIAKGKISLIQVQNLKASIRYYGKLLLL